MSLTWHCSIKVKVTSGVFSIYHNTNCSVLSRLSLVININVSHESDYVKSNEINEFICSFVLLFPENLSYFLSLKYPTFFSQTLVRGLNAFKM